MSDLLNVRRSSQLSSGGAPVNASSGPKPYGYQYNSGFNKPM